MMIEEIKKNYANKSFVELESNYVPSQEFMPVKNLDDFLKNSYKMVYISKKMSEQEIIFRNLSSCLGSFSYRSKCSMDFVNFVKNNPTQKLKELCRKGPHDILILYSLDLPLKYTLDENTLTKDERELVLDELKILFAKYKNKGADKEQEIREYIQGFMQLYKKAKTKKEQAKIISDVKFSLKDKFDVDGRNNKFASYSAVRNILING